MLKQLRNPLTVLHVGLPARHLLDVSCIYQQHGKSPLPGCSRLVSNIRMPQTHFHRFWVPLKRHDDWFVNGEYGKRVCLLLHFCVTILSFPGKLNFLELRVQNIDFARNETHVRNGKGAKYRMTTLPELLKKPLQDHLLKVRTVHERDLAEGWGRVQMPDALDRKYPNAPADWRGQWVFPQENRWKNT